MISHILYFYMLQMLYVRASEQKRFLDIRRFTNKKLLLLLSEHMDILPNYYRQ